MDNEYQWVSDFKVKIASYLKMKIPQSHPGTYVTDKSKDLSKPSFPTVYFKIISLKEIGEDLDAQSINGIDVTYEVSAITNTSQEDAERIMGTVTSLFKKLGKTNITYGPQLNNDSEETYRSTAKYRMVVGADDTL